MIKNRGLLSRYHVFIVFLSLIFCVFLLRLIQLQILYKDFYGKKSEENSVRHIPLMPIRGYIYDRRGILVVDNHPSFTATITPAEFDSTQIPLLSKVLLVDEELIRERLRKGFSQNRFAPIKIKRDIDYKMLAFIEENRGIIPGVYYQTETKRYYATSAKAPHLFGYTKEISENQLASMPTYQMGDLIGASGLEAFYENYLRGRKGFQFITVNALGQNVGSYNEGKNDIPLREGDDLYITLDAELQAFAESLMVGKKGAIVAIDPQTGGILALVSKPDYDPVIMSGYMSPATWNQLFNDPSKLLFNRATQTRYPPGSTFKMVLAAAALQDGKISPNWRVNCTGSFRFGNKVFTDLHVHGSVDVYEAIQKSCNVFFYQLMLKTGFKSWTNYAREFGFGAKTGIDLHEEDPGLVPSEEYYNKVYGKDKWTTGYLISLAIGQGELGVSPLQMACYAMVLGNRGYYHQPHVVHKIRNVETDSIYTLPRSTRKLKISPLVFEIIREGMYRCVNVPGGTGSAARVQGIKVAGKTGTAENPHGKDHAWFIGYAPVDSPQIAICVLVENIGFGGAFAAPIAGLCIEKYIYRDLIRNKPQHIADEKVMARTITSN